MSQDFLIQKYDGTASFERIRPISVSELIQKKKKAGQISFHIPKFYSKKFNTITAFIINDSDKEIRVEMVDVVTINRVFSEFIEEKEWKRFSKIGKPTKKDFFYKRIPPKSYLRLNVMNLLDEETQEKQFRLSTIINKKTIHSNAVLLKPNITINKYGTVSETMDFINFSYAHSMEPMGNKFDISISRSRKGNHYATVHLLRKNTTITSIDTTYLISETTFFNIMHSLNNINIIELSKYGAYGVDGYGCTLEFGKLPSVIKIQVSNPHASMPYQQSFLESCALIIKAAQLDPKKIL